MDLDYVGLVEERNAWRKLLEDGHWIDPHILAEYRLNRDSDLWRSTRQVEKLCEYILFLECRRNEYGGKKA